MQTPEQLTEELKASQGGNLRAVAIYGSAAAGDRTRKYSDINLLVVLERLDSAVLMALAALFAAWIKSGNKAPVIFVENQLRSSQDVFPIELGDIRDRHRMLHGDAALLESIRIQPAHLRHQLEFELRSKQFLLRQAFVESAGRSGAVEEILARSLSSVTALFRGILRLAGIRAPSSTPEVLRAVAARAPIDAEAWEMVWRLRQGERLPRGVTPEQIFDRLMAGLQSAVNFVDAFPAS
jgi:hypothetical protein